jgi:hypothetical protein
MSHLFAGGAGVDIARSSYQTLMLDISILSVGTPKIRGVLESAESTALTVCSSAASYTSMARVTCAASESRADPVYRRRHR